jgi:hypothetical protein
MSADHLEFGDHGEQYDDSDPLDSDVDPIAEDQLDTASGRNFVWCGSCCTAHLPGAHDAQKVAAEKIRRWSWGATGMHPADDNYLAAALYVRETDLMATEAQRDVLAEDRERFRQVGEQVCYELKGVTEQLAERVRRHESDGRDLEQLRITVRDESRRAHDAEVQVDALADALLRLRSGLPKEYLIAKTYMVPCSGDLIEKLDAALRKAGR